MAWELVTFDKVIFYDIIGFMPKEDNARIEYGIDALRVIGVYLFAGLGVISGLISCDVRTPEPHEITDLPKGVDQFSAGETMKKDTWFLVRHYNYEDNGKKIFYYVAQTGKDWVYKEDDWRDSKVFFGFSDKEALNEFACEHIEIDKMDGFEVKTFAVWCSVVQGQESG